MAENKKRQAGDPEVAIETAIYKSENFIQRNGRTLLAILGVIVLFVGGYFGVKTLYSEPRQQKASAMMFMAEQQFARDSFALALKGDGNYPGFLDVIDQYGNTRAGNVAKHYAGKCYMYLGEYQAALDCFKKYKNAKGISAQIINAQNAGMMGDAYVQLDELKTAAEHYEKAVKLSDNDLTAPYYLKKAGMVYEKLGDDKKAMEAYEKIKYAYGRSMESRDIDKYIGRLTQQEAQKN